ncbi:MAG: hypothetical protein QM704_07955 [Anaeromyxobacteraceae bacterium]
MTTALLLALSARLALAEAPTPAPAAAPDAASSAPAEVRAGDEGVFRLRRGGTIAGRVVSRDAARDVLRLRSGQEVVLPAGDLVARVGDYEEPDAPRPGDARRIRLALKDGSNVEGELVARGASSVTIRVDGQERTYPWSAVRGVFEYASLLAHRGGPADAAGVRYVHASSATGLPAGGLVVDATAEGLALGWGVARWLTASAGVSTPYRWNGRAVAPDYVLGADGHVPLLPWLSASAGVRAQRTGRGNVVWAEGALTAGGEDFHATVFAGPPLAGAGRLGAFDGAAVGAALSSRFTARVTGILEAFTTPQGGTDVAGAAAARLHLASAWSVELGALGSRRAVLPWLAVTWRRDGGAP